MKIELTEKEIKMLIGWFNLADAYVAERGIDPPDEDIELIEKLRRSINE